MLALGLVPRLRRDPDRIFGIALLLAILGSPLGWVHYLPLLLPAFGLLLSARVRPRAARSLSAAGLALLWLFPANGLLLAFLWPVAPGFPVAALPTLGLLALLGALVLTWGARPSAPAPSAEPAPPTGPSPE